MKTFFKQTPALTGRLLILWNNKHQNNKIITPGCALKMYQVSINIRKIMNTTTTNTHTAHKFMMLIK